MCTGTCTLLTIVFGNICLWRFWLASYLQARLSASMFFDWTSHCFYKYRTLTTILISYSSQTITKIYWSTASSIFHMVTVLLLASLFLFGVINKSACWHTSPYIIMWRRGVISIPPPPPDCYHNIFVCLPWWPYPYKMYMSVNKSVAILCTHIRCLIVNIVCMCICIVFESDENAHTYVPQSNQASIFSHM